MQWYSDSRRSLVRFWTHNRHPIPHLAGLGSNVSMTDAHAAFTSIPIGPSSPEYYQNSKCSISNTYLNACFWRVGWCLYTMGLLPDTQKKCGLHIRWKCREHFHRLRGLAFPTCIPARAWRTCRDACRDCELVASFEVGGGKNVPDIPGACASRNFAYLVRGPCDLWLAPLVAVVRTTQTRKP